MADRTQINKHDEMVEAAVAGEAAGLLSSETEAHAKIRIKHSNGSSNDALAKGKILKQHGLMQPEEEDWRYPSPAPPDTEFGIKNSSINATNVPALTSPTLSAGQPISISTESSAKYQLSTPEEQNLITEISSKSRPFDAEQRQNVNPPSDKYNAVYLIILCHGIAVLLSWNMIITAADYFKDYKLNTPESKDKDYRLFFLPYAAIAAQVPQFIFCLLNVILNFGGNLTRRVVFSVMVMLMVYTTFLVLAFVDSQSWPYEYFIVIIVLIVILNMFNGIYQNSIYGVAGMLPGKYSNAVVLGNNISGTLCALIGIAAKYFTSSCHNVNHIAAAEVPAPGANVPTNSVVFANSTSMTTLDAETGDDNLEAVRAANLRMSGIIYFSAVLIVLLLAFQSYFILPFLRFFSFYQRAQTNYELAASTSGREKKKPLISLVSFGELWRVFRQIKMQCFNVFFVFVVTLSLFPAIQAPIQSQYGNASLFSCYFALVTCFLSFNFFAMIGNLLPSLTLWPGPRTVIVPIVMRVLFVPFMMLCNAPFDGKRRPSIPILIDNDIVYILGSILFALTSGYYCSLAMIYAPRIVETKDAPRAAQIASFFLVLGVTTGVLVSKVLVSILTVDV